MKEKVEVQKVWHRSRTIILAIGQVLAGIGALILEDPTIGWGLMIKSALDILLRCDTWKEIGTS